MERPAKRAFVLAVAVVLAMLIAGCGEENSANIKKHRLIAAENIQLKKALEQRNKKLEKYLQEKKSLEERSSAGMQYLSQTLMEENQKLRKQIESLKAQVQELEKELGELKKPATPEPL